MPAAINIEQWTGPNGSPTKTAIANGATILSGTADSLSPPPVPQDGTLTGGGFRQSYATYTRLNCTALPLGIVNNLQWYCSTTIPSDWVSSFNSGYNLTCSASVFNSTFYNQATGTPNVAGTSMITLGYGSGSNIFTATAASPFIPGGSIQNTNTVPNDTWSGLAAYQFSIPPKWANSTTQTGVTPGTKTAVQFNWQYDEV